MPGTYTVLPILLPAGCQVNPVSATVTVPTSVPVTFALTCG
jgi:hypothetical protein